MKTDTLVTLLSLLLTLAAMMYPHDPVHESEDTSGAARRGEHLIIFALLTATLLLRFAYVFRYPIESDEPQHLHVVWGWVHGLLQYRDVFDNHTPLFHLLCTPLLVVFGERPEVLYCMRLAMIPLYAVVLWSTYTLGRVLFSRRVGLWATVFAGLFPSFFLCSLEFRTDELWTALWLLALVVLVAGPTTSARSFLVGVILGAALGASMKTILLLAALGGAVLAAVVLTAQSRSPSSLRHLGRGAAAALVGFSLVPLALTLFFTVEGALTPFFYGTVAHNTLSGLGRWHTQPAQVLFFPAMLPFLWWGARTIGRCAPSTSIGARRVIIFLAAQVYLWALLSFWPLLEREHYLPFYPLAILFLTPVILALPSWIAVRARNILPTHPLPGALGPVLVAILEITWLLAAWPLWRDGTRDATDLLVEVLRLTHPSDPIMDLKGETVFRQRPFYYVLEGITNERIRRGLIADNIPECLIATRTCVAVVDNDRFPSRARTFLQENYLPVGRLRVVGRLLTPPAQNGTPSFPFEVQIPARYVIVAESGNVVGWLDGTPYEGARFLAPAPHEFRSASGQGRFALVWAQAVERGFSPFLLRSGSP